MLARPDAPAEQDCLVATGSDPQPGPFQDIPRPIWAIFLSAWGLLFLTFLLVFTVNTAATFAVTIAAGFALMAFGLPLVLAAQGRSDGFKCSGIIETRTGPLSPVAAGAQIVAVPLCALIGLAAFITLALWGSA